MPSGDLIISLDYDTAKAEAKQRKLNREMELSQQKAENFKKEMATSSKNIKQTTAEILRLKEELAEISSQNREKFLAGTITNSDKAAYKAKSAEIQKQNALLEKQKSVLLGQEISLNKQNAKTAAIGDKILLNTKKQNKFTKAFAKSQKSADRFGRRLKSLIASALFFSVVTKAFTALRNEFGKLITETGTKTAKLVAQLNGSLAVLGRTLYEGAKPYIEWILEKLVKMVNVLSYGLAKILGKNVNEMKKLAKQTKKTGEEAQKSTASFDTLQKADSSKSSNGSESGVGTDFGALESGISSATAALMAILSGALLVVGAILAFTGTNIPLGIGLIAIGAIGLASAAAATWGSLNPEIQNTILILTTIISAALIVIGFILIATGIKLGLGIALLALGAAGLVTTAALKWDALPSKTKNIITIITAIVSGALLVLGAILAFTGVNLPLGIAFIALGAVGLIATVALSWNNLSDKLKNIISIITTIVSAAFLVLGTILAFTGVNIPLGIALIAIGAVGLVAAAVANWSLLSENIKATITIITMIVSGALLVLGVILAFTGANIPLGIGLIALGAAGLVGAAKLGWNTLPEKTKNIITTIMAIGGALFLLLGLILILTGAGIPLGIGCILLGVTAIGGAVALTPGDSFLEKVKNLWNNVKKIVKDFIKWFSDNVLDGIFGEGFGDTLCDMWDTFTGLWEDIISFFKNVFSGKWKEAGKDLLNILIGIVNLFISKINLAIQGFLGGGSKLINAIGGWFGADWNLDASGIKIPLIPKLATGAVIPGGFPFLAWLGDQPKGQTNIEAPADLIRQIVREESGGKKFEVKATGSMAQLIRLLRLEIKEEDDRASVF